MSEENKKLTQSPLNKEIQNLIDFINGNTEKLREKKLQESSFYFYESVEAIMAGRLSKSQSALLLDAVTQTQNLLEQTLNFKIETKILETSESDENDLQHQLKAALSAPIDAYKETIKKIQPVFKSLAGKMLKILGAVMQAGLCVAAGVGLFAVTTPFSFALAPVAAAAAAGVGVAALGVATFFAGKKLSNPGQQKKAANVEDKMQGVVGAIESLAPKT